MEAAKVGYEKLLNTLRNLQQELQKAESEQRNAGENFDLTLHKKRFLDAMEDDFNTPLAVGVLFDVVRELNQALNSEQKLNIHALKEIELFFDSMGGEVLGVLPGTFTQPVGDTRRESELMQLILQVRSEVRKQKLWTLSDVIRDGLTAAGFVIEDKKEGTSWRKA